MKLSFILTGLVLSGLLLAGCQTAVPNQPAAETETNTAVPPTASPLPSPPTPPVTPAAASSATPRPSPIPPTPIPTAVPTATPTTVPTATPISLCSQRLPGDDLFTLVTQTYNLSKEYAPSDLVPLGDYLPVDVTLGYPTELRQIAVEPLVEMINDMKAAGLQPQILSGYRSYSAQSIAWNKWSREYPDHAGIISARPGHSEHQLGTAVDFGSPSLPEIVGQPDIQFHTYFFKTPEGIWLAENAHRYGFTLSYTREASEVTGFFYEPWHYRYVGVEMATRLKEEGVTLTEYQLANQPEPCIPDE